MAVRFFSDSKRPVHSGPYPLERLPRARAPLAMGQVPAMAPLDFHRPADPLSVVNAMGEYQAMMDAIRDGMVNRAQAQCPEDPLERSQHLKAFAYFSDTDMAGVCELHASDLLAQPRVNGDIAGLAQALRTRQTKTLASGIDLIMADLKESMDAPPTTIEAHTHALVLLQAYPRDPGPDEAGCEWIQDAQAHRACLRSSETAVVLANYLRLLGFDARAHTVTSTDVDVNRLAVRAGLAEVVQSAPEAAGDGTAVLSAPFVGQRFGLAVVTTTMRLAPDAPLAKGASGHVDWRWRLGWGSRLGAWTRDAFARRAYADGPHPFETLRRVSEPTTFIDEPRVARVPKRADMFARAQFGDMGKANQAGAKGGHYARKAAPSMAQRRLLGALVLLQDGEAAQGRAPGDARTHAASVKALSYFLGLDAVGISRCPSWAWYSHDARGEPITPPHDQAISMIVDQGYETMDGASGDDWISVAQSMRAYLRFSVLGGVVAQHIRNLGYSAKAHTVLDGEVLQPPLLLLSGLGEVSRIGEVILNPFLGPRLKSGVVTTDMPMTHDLPIDFGLQHFCESCNKCARECPSGAITAGPKRMFNGYEIWKSDSQKCATYRITTPGGAMCGRCMKTCPWNLEGLFVQKPFRWAAMHVPQAAPALAWLDDALGRGAINPHKKWWWDLELDARGAYAPSRHPVNTRGLQRGLKLRAQDQTMAVYPAPLAPPPWPYPYPMDREAGIAAYRRLVSAGEYRRRLAAGDLSMVHRYEVPHDAPVLQVEVSRVQVLSPSVTLYTLTAVEGQALPAWEAGAHIDVVVAPEFLRQYSLCGDPADRSAYTIAVLREDSGRGGSALMHRIFVPGRRVFVSKPMNHFPLHESAVGSLLMGGGIGVTPMIAMAHRLHALGRAFALHYSAPSWTAAACAPLLQDVPWRDRVHVHITDSGSRADLNDVVQQARLRWGESTDGNPWRVYACGPDGYMAAVTNAAQAAGVPKAHTHVEYFAPPQDDELPTHAFEVRLARSGRQLSVPPEQSLADVLQAAGLPIAIKCADGICGVCQCTVLQGEVAHRDFVLAQDQRAHTLITCKSRAAQPGGVLVLDL